MNISINPITMAESTNSLSDFVKYMESKNKMTDELKSHINDFNNKKYEERRTYNVYVKDTLENTMKYDTTKEIRSGTLFMTNSTGLW